MGVQQGRGENDEPFSARRARRPKRRIEIRRPAYLQDLQLKPERPGGDLELRQPARTKRRVRQDRDARGFGDNLFQQL